MKARLAALTLLVLGTTAASAFAQTTRFVVPYTPGAANDTLARVLAQHLGAETGQPVVVDNRPGAGGHLAAEQVAHATPDGHTLLVTTNGLMAIGPHLYRKLPYDPEKDLTPVIRFANVPYALAVAPELGIKTVGELIALAKARPEQINFASSGNGSVPHLCGELINLQAGVKMTHVPYKGGAQAMNDVMTGTVQLYCGSIPSLISFAQSGRLVLIGVTSAQRSSLLPDLQTLEEQGLHGVEVDSWVGLHAPGATAAGTIQQIYRQVARLMDTDEMRRIFLTQGALPEALAPDDFAAKVREESARWAPVVTASGATLD
jgi:tripartite-type tricarboxylate transporter receptor subunit TctC